MERGIICGAINRQKKPNMRWMEASVKNNTRGGGKEKKTVVLSIRTPWSQKWARNGSKAVSRNGLEMVAKEFQE